jgi:cAMP-dependent protein kinase regulator
MRTSVSAEAYGKFNKKGTFQARVIPKTSEQKARIEKRLG